MRPGYLAVAVGTMCALAGGCATNAPGDLNQAASNVLAPAVQHVREVASTGDYPQLKAAVTQLKALVRQEERSGDVSPSRATAIEDAADVLLLDAKPKPKPTPSPTTPTVTPTTESPTPSATPTTTSPTPTTTTSPIISTSAAAGSPGTEPSGH
jgi:hypothetical protein